MALTTTDPVPATKPPATPTPKVMNGCSAVNAYNWDKRTAYAICMAESGGIAHKNNAGLNRDGSVDYGLMQINSIHSDMVGGDLEALYDPATNIKIAYSLSHGGTDWTPWTAYNTGKYLKFL